MRWDDARERVAERSAAAFGLDADASKDEMFSARIVPRDLARKMLSGVMEGPELDAAVLGMRDATMNTLKAMVSADDEGGIHASLHGALTQVLLLGILVGSHPRGGGASQRPSDDFDGATE